MFDFEEEEEYRDETDTGDEAEQYDAFREEDIAAEKEIVAEGKDYTLIEVDLWATSLHDAKIGIRQDAQYQSKSRQFTKTSEVIGNVVFHTGWDENRQKENYEEVITIDQEFWDIGKKSKIMQIVQDRYSDYDPKKFARMMRKLVIKTFVDLGRKQEERMRGRWTGSFEESQVMSLVMTFGDRRRRNPLPFFYVDIPGFKYRVPVTRVHTIIGDRYVFPMIDDETNSVVPYLIEERRFTFGQDYQLFDGRTMKKIAVINDVAINIGGKVNIKFKKPKIDKNGELIDPWEHLRRNYVFQRIIILFAASLNYFHSIYRQYRRVHRAMKTLRSYQKDKGKLSLMEQEEKYRQAKKKMRILKWYPVWAKELSLHYNPRRVRT
ncbi:MAG: hypothetical protein JW776_09565 [Candidatus Lokiarchaeota archaeon]|nr:hypothetical protein [Candidatus Lokiarchaeota archaeon]